MEKFTSGPWKVGVNYTSNRKSHIPINSSENQAIVVTWPVSHEITDEDVANAKLIAAAPEMYDTLKGILNDDYKNVGEMKDQINHVLAKINQ